MFVSPSKESKARHTTRKDNNYFTSSDPTMTFQSFVFVCCGCVLWLCAVVVCCGCALWLCAVDVSLCLCVCSCVWSGSAQCARELAVEVSGMEHRILPKPLQGPFWVVLPSDRVSARSQGRASNVAAQSRWDGNWFNPKRVVFCEASSGVASPRIGGMFKILEPHVVFLFFRGSTYGFR